MQPLFFVEARPGLGTSRSIPGSLTKRHPELMDLHDASEEMVQKAQRVKKKGPVRPSFPVVVCCGGRKCRDHVLDGDLAASTYTVFALPEVKRVIVPSYCGRHCHSLLAKGWTRPYGHNFSMTEQSGTGVSPLLRSVIQTCNDHCKQPVGTPVLSTVET